MGGRPPWLPLSFPISISSRVANSRTRGTFFAMEENGPHIVVLGAGFGGLTFCQHFSVPQTRITLVDRQNHHLFQPLLYQVATAGLAATDVAQPIRSILSDRPHVTVLLDEVREIKLDLKEVRLHKAVLRYDYLVLALGGVTSYFGHPAWEEFAPGLKTIDDALRIRREILLAFEEAETEKDAARLRELLTLVVVGGGPTGVELAGALAELARFVLVKDFQRINPAAARVILIEAGPRLLASLPETLSEKAEEQLLRLGVEVRKNAPVQSISRRRVELKEGVIAAANILWAAGIAAVPLARNLGVETDHAGRVKVNSDLSLPGYPNVFAMGDMALVLDEEGKPVPGVSPAAMQMAKHTARMIGEELTFGEHAKRRPFRYWDKGTMATIGRSAAVAKIKRLEFSGFPAWMAWLVVHLIFLVGFRNKLSVLLEWAYSYLTYKRGARIITGLSEREKKPEG
jgi:NADH:ubiquinone reductase (H+-translocating)